MKTEIVFSKKLRHIGYTCLALPFSNLWGLVLWIYSNNQTVVFNDDESAFTVTPNNSILSPPPPPTHHIIARNLIPMQKFPEQAEIMSKTLIISNVR